MSLTISAGRRANNQYELYFSSMHGNTKWKKWSNRALHWNVEESRARVTLRYAAWQR
jgi:hypothetical protein